jgi:hypothetical protein
MLLQTLKNVIMRKHTFTNTVVYLDIKSSFRRY